MPREQVADWFEPTAAEPSAVHPAHLASSAGCTPLQLHFSRLADTGYYYREGVSVNRSHWVLLLGDGNSSQAALAGLLAPLSRTFLRRISNLLCRLQHRRQSIAFGMCPPVVPVLLRPAAVVATVAARQPPMQHIIPVESRLVTRHRLRAAIPPVPLSPPLARFHRAC